MTKEDLMALRTVVGDMRFIQAAALVASGGNDAKGPIEYMKKLARLDKMLTQEIMK